VLGQIVREPVLHFAVLGLCLWAGITSWNSHERRYTVTVDAAQQKRLAGLYAEQFGNLPSRAQMRVLLNSFVEEEIGLREGLSLHLDRDDEIIRRRIIQKYEFLQADAAVPPEPTPAQLHSWFLEHRELYRESGHLTMSHLYFSSDQDGEAGARARAVAVLDRLRVGGSSPATGMGDPFPGPADIATLTPADAARIFGQSEMSSRVFEVPLASWQGPLRSGYGWHLVRVSDRVAPRFLAPEEVRERLRNDYLDEQRRILKARAFERVRSKYTVRVVPLA
jgi:peptidyl-prolyl cis-trans isomerase C